MPCKLSYNGTITELMKECLSSCKPVFLSKFLYRFIYSNALQFFNFSYFRICVLTVWCCELRVHIIQEKIIIFGSMRQWSFKHGTFSIYGFYSCINESAYWLKNWLVSRRTRHGINLYMLYQFIGNNKHRHNYKFDIHLHFGTP